MEIAADSGLEKREMRADSVEFPKSRQPRGQSMRRRSRAHAELREQLS
jgi:hypothetical protein